MRRVPTLLVGGDLGIEVLLAGASCVNVVARAAGVPAVPVLLAEHSVDLVVLHVRHAGRAELDLLSTLDWAKPRPSIFVLYDARCARTANEIWRAGADNVLLPPFSTEAVAAGVDHALRQIVRDPEDPLPPMTRRFADRHADRRATAMLVARFEGDSNAEVAERMGVSVVAVSLKTSALSSNRSAPAGSSSSSAARPSFSGPNGTADDPRPADTRSALPARASLWPS